MSAIPMRPLKITFMSMTPVRSLPEELLERPPPLAVEALEERYVTSPRRSLRLGKRKRANPPPPPAKKRVRLRSARTSARTKSVRDPWVNMLRTTAETFAAAIGGADFVALRIALEEAQEVSQGIVADLTAAVKEAEGYKLFLSNRSYSTTGYLGVYNYQTVSYTHLTLPTKA